MTQIKFDTKVLAGVGEALDGHAEDMFRQRAGRWVAVVELAHVERTEPGRDEEKETSVKLRITGIEIAPDELVDEQLREAMRDMYKRRTRSGTLFQDGEDAPAGTRPVGDLIPPALPPGHLVELEPLDAEIVEDEANEDHDNTDEPVDLADHDEDDTDDGDPRADVA
ncbi:hypothetical protein ACIBSV_12215 [Embleya sp. NPDC050154]|uniref:hypothetical protein n=1 Tax=Embleya sp. NPDC050154 TaxID=3363988 RepID=UPI0037AE2CB1